MASFPLTFIFFRGVGQPPTSHYWPFFTIINLVGGLEHEFYFSIYWNIGNDIIPTDELRLYPHYEPMGYPHGPWDPWVQQLSSKSIHWCSRSVHGTHHGTPSHDGTRVPNSRDSFHDFAINVPSCFIKLKNQFPMHFPMILEGIISHNQSMAIFFGYSQFDQSQGLVFAPRCSVGSGQSRWGNFSRASAGAMWIYAVCEAFSHSCGKANNKPCPNGRWFLGLPH